MTVADALLVIDIENGRQQRVVLAQNQSVVEVLQHVPCGFLNLVAREYKVYALVYGVLHLNSQYTRVSMKILSLALKTIETVCILQIECCDTSHNRNFLLV